MYDVAAPRMVRYALAITRNPHDAEDAAQAVLLKIAVRPSLISGADQAWPYLLKMVRNQALSLMRRRERLKLVASLHHICWEAPDHCLEVESRKAVWNALRKLPALQAEVVVLKIWEEMTFAEIGQVLGKSSHTVASRYRYALQKLAGHLKPEPEKADVHKLTR